MNFVEYFSSALSKKTKVTSRNVLKIGNLIRLEFCRNLKNKNGNCNIIGICVATTSKVVKMIIICKSNDSQE